MGRTGEYINDSWRFSKCGAAQPGKLASPGIDDSGWQEVSFPHTWNSADCTGTVDPAPECSEGYYRGAGCYRRKVFLANEQYRGREVFIEFGGANTVTELYINGRKVGGHEGGYSAFGFNITKYVSVGTDNLLWRSSAMRPQITLHRYATAAISVKWVGFTARFVSFPQTGCI